MYISYRRTYRIKIILKFFRECIEFSGRMMNAMNNLSQYNLYLMPLAFKHPADNKGVNQPYPPCPVSRS